MFAAFAVLLLTAASDNPTGRFLCSKANGVFTAGRPWLLAEVEESQDKALLRKTLTVKMDGYTAVFDVAKWRAGKALSLTTIKLDTWAPPPNTSYPLTIDFRINGVSVNTQTFAGPNMTLVNFVEPDRDQPRLRGASRWRERPAVEFEPIPTTARLFGASDVELAGRTGEGRTLAALHLPVPDWEMVAAFSAATFPELEQSRRSGQCRQIVMHVGS